MGAVRLLSDIVCNQRPLMLKDTAPVGRACQHMRERKTGSVLVVDDAGRLVGIFTGRDAVRRVLAAGKNAATTLREVMTADPVTISSNKSSIEALRTMWDGGFRHLPLMDGDKILGVISRGDFESSEQLQLDEERQLWEHMR
ncbi:MAG: CBS domain-containing protein [Rhizomicrobium sp.]